MQFFVRSRFAFSCLTLVTGFAITPVAHGELLNSFESDNDVKKPVLDFTQCIASRSNKGVTDGNSAIYAAFAASPTAYPGFNTIYSNLNLSNAGIIAIYATNFSPQAQTFAVPKAAARNLQFAAGKNGTITVIEDGKVRTVRVNPKTYTVVVDGFTIYMDGKRTPDGSLIIRVSGR